MRTRTSRSPRRKVALFASTMVALAGCLGFSAASASAAPELIIEDSALYPTYPTPGQPGNLFLVLGNAGDTATDPSEPPILEIKWPAGMTSAGISSSGSFSCDGAPGATEETCTYTPSGSSDEGLGPNMLFPTSGLSVTNRLRFDVDPSATGSAQGTITVYGGGDTTPEVETFEAIYSATPLPFGVTPGTFAAGAFDESGNDYLQAGGHPYDATAYFETNTEYAEKQAGGFIKDIVVELPPGFVGDPTSVPQCTQAQMGVVPPECPPESQVGISDLFTLVTPANYGLSPVYNMVPRAGLPAELAFRSPGGIIKLEPSVRSDGDYGITMNVRELPEIAGGVFASEFTIWGYPMDPTHDAQRCAKPNFLTKLCDGIEPVQGTDVEDNADGINAGLPRISDAPRMPFLTQPTYCANPVGTEVLMNPWLNPVEDIEDKSDPNWYRVPTGLPQLGGCEKLPFAPTISLQPNSKAADTPSGLVARLNIPQQKDSEPDGLATAHLKKATVTLPQGVTISPSQANGVDACTPQQIGLISAPGQKPRFNNDIPNCPTASKIGFAKVVSPLLEGPLDGEVFLASQNNNPFNSQFAIYMTVREPSIQVKLPGLVELNHATGQITTTFDNNPQLPFSDLTLTFFDGARAPLAMPQTCGTFTNHSTFSSWAAKDPNNPAPSEIVTINDSFGVNQGANGAPCAASKAQLPFNLGLKAGAVNPLAGAKSPFNIQITRPDGSQELTGLDLSPPPGFTASLKGVPYCSEAQLAAAAANSGKAERVAPSCPPASQIGNVSAGAGPGADPIYVPGKLYLAGPYKGAPLSAVAITPAVAGPFDLGNVVIRSALQVDPSTARITAKTDPIPSLVDGVELRIRDVRIHLDRPNWAINPTSCEAMAVDVTAYGAGGAASKLSNRFQVGGCDKLPFAPVLKAHLKGGTKRNANPAFTATLTAKPGEANIARVAVTLPHSAFLDQSHIKTICTRVQFAAKACPAGSVYGFAEATTPLLDDPIKGPVYLRSSSNKLPDLVAALRGPDKQPIEIALAGRIDSVKGGIRNTFDVIPDAPVSKFVLRMQGGKKGLLVNSRNLCARPARMNVKLTGQNGKRADQRPLLTNSCKKKGKKSAKKKAGK